MLGIARNRPLPVRDLLMSPPLRGWGPTPPPPRHPAMGLGWVGQPPELDLALQPLLMDPGEARATPGLL